MLPRRFLAAAMLAGAALGGCGGAATSAPPSISPDKSGATPAASSLTTEPSQPAQTAGVGTEGPAVEPVIVEIADAQPFTWRFAVAPDGQSALIGQSSGFFPSTRESRIVQVRLQSDGSWGSPEPVSLSTEATADLDPFYTPDGSRLWFSSIRPVDGEARSDTDLWYVDVAEDGTFGEPVNPGPAVNSPREDLYPTVGPDGALYFGSDRGGNGFDIWRTLPNPDGTWGTPEALPAPVTTAAWEFNPALAPDGQTLVFTGLNREGGLGAGDLWFSTPDGDGWSEPVLLEAVNTSGDEYHASFSPDGTTLYFVRGGRLHQVPVDALGLPAAS